MKFTCFFLMLIVSLPVLAQSKKKQIEALNKRVDSLNLIVISERNTILENNVTISESNKTIEELNEKISSLENSSKQLNETILDLKQELQIRNSELTSIQSLLKSKTDSLALISEELEELKPKPKPQPVIVNTNTGPYKTVTIGTQVWMTKNLDVSTFRNGDPIPQAKTDEEWKKSGENKEPAWCYYENDPANGVKYGKLYNWYAVNDSRGLAPAGYHVPSDAEWTTLKDHLGADAGKKMKSKSGWSSYKEDITCANCKNWNTEYRRKTACHVCKDTRVKGQKTISGNGTNSSGFSGIPGGKCEDNGVFYYVGNWGYWWSATESRTNSVYSCNLSFTSHVFSFGNDKERGLSVRCLRA